MLAAFLLAAQVGPAPIDRSPRLRATLPNGAAIGAEVRPTDRRIVLQAVLANPEGDRPTEYGQRHLLEHLVAARDPEVDRKLETLGGAMGASTGRDGLRLWISVPPDSLNLGLITLRDLLKPITLRSEEVARERAIVRREIALLTPEERAGMAAWRDLYGEAGIDPVGLDAPWDDATPEALERLWRGMLIGPRLSLFVAGPIELDATVERLERIARTLPDGPRPAWGARAAVKTSAAPGMGTYALAVGPLDERTTLAAIATGLALASEVEGSSLTYSPSPREGAVILANGADPESLGRAVRRGDVGLRNRALSLARSWLAAKTSNSAESSEIRATLSGFRAGLVPERLASVLTEVREPDLDAAFARWGTAAR